MNTEREDIVANIVQAAGGRLVSRIRLQKVAYLLDQLGGQSGFHYAYHHYGPYSRDLDNAVEDAKAFGLLKEEIARRQSDGATYSIFTSKEKAHSEFPGSAELQARVKGFSQASIVILELAATAHWLTTAEKVADWRTEIQRRKGSKAAGGRLEKALDLLKDLKLPPAENAA